MGFPSNRRVAFPQENSTPASKIFKHTSVTLRPQPIPGNHTQNFPRNHSRTLPNAIDAVTDKARQTLPICTQCNNKWRCSSNGTILLTLHLTQKRRRTRLYPSKRCARSAQDNPLKKKKKWLNRRLKVDFFVAARTSTIAFRPGWCGDQSNTGLVRFASGWIMENAFSMYCHRSIPFFPAPSTLSIPVLSLDQRARSALHVLVFNTRSLASFALD